MKMFRTIAFAAVLASASAADKKNIRGASAFERMLRADFGTKCESNPVCAALGLEGACCPSADGVMLDCCNRSCEAHSACEGLGEPENCCPTPDGVELACCDHTEKLAESQHQCGFHPRCADVPLADACCPTTEGVFLDCCLNKPANPMDPRNPQVDNSLPKPPTDPTDPVVDNSLPTDCSLFPACAAQGLTGECCNTVDGVYLDCCKEEQPTNMCSSHLACGGLEGACCPTSEGVFLDCCDNNPMDPRNPQVDNSLPKPPTDPTDPVVDNSLPTDCSLFPACAAQGLTGECCNTVDGVYLDCCNEEQPTNMCSSHSACAGLEGACCPTSEGVFLDCCDA